MKKVELLSPAGSYESGLAAIQNGCDALYLALSRFGARAFANNFDRETLIKMVQYAHVYGVKVYVTMNTLVHEREMEECLACVDFLYQSNVDALIVQDLGLLYEIRTTYPNFEVHASTQMHVVNKEALRFLHSIGVMRAVLAREVNIDEIPDFSKENIELEVFVHGALCVAYSGQCLMSSMVGGRSGNRGECAQTCRMPYSLIAYDNKKEYHNSAYLLSLKDLNTLEYIPQLMKAGISSFKIEGRMKKSEYVAHVTSMYRKAIDDSTFCASEKEKETTKFLFHRGFTAGFLFKNKGSELYNPYRPNHIGIKVGDVLSYANGKVKIKLQYAINQHDGIRILMDKEDYGFKVNRLYLNGQLVNSAKAGSIVEIGCHEPMSAGSRVVKTSDPQIEKEIRLRYEKIQRRVSVQMEVIAKVGEPFCICVKDGSNRVECYSSQVLEAAQNRATTKEDIQKQCAKLNDTLFCLENIRITMFEEVFIPIKMINEVRREAIQKMYDLRSQTITRDMIPFNHEVKMQKKHPFAIVASVLNEEQLLAVVDCVDWVYVRDIDLYKAYKNNSKVLLSGERVQKVGYENVKVIQDIGGLYAVEQAICDAPLNVYNASTLHFLSERNVESVTFSQELSLQDIIYCLKRYQQKYNDEVNTEVIIYGRVEVMVSEHCPINACLLDNNKESCTLCRKTTFALKDKFNNEYPMFNDTLCRMHLYDYKIEDRILDAKQLLDCGVNRLRLNFTFESKEEVLKIVNKLKQSIRV